jgi:hypothetical protein
VLQLPKAAQSSRQALPYKLLSSGTSSLGNEREPISMHPGAQTPSFIVRCHKRPPRAAPPRISPSGPLFLRPTHLTLGQRTSTSNRKVRLASPWQTRTNPSPARS